MQSIQQARRRWRCAAWLRDVVYWLLYRHVSAWEYRARMAHEQAIADAVRRQPKLSVSVR